MCESSTLSHDDTDPQDPRGCRYIFGDPGEPGWRYCQGAIVPGGKLGSVERPPYCAEHTAVCLKEANPYYIERWIRRQAASAPFLDRNVWGCGENRGDGQRMAVDTLLKVNNAGVFIHD